MTYTTQNTLSKLMPSTYVRRKIGIYVHNITPRPLSRTRGVHRQICRNFGFVRGHDFLFLVSGVGLMLLNIFINTIICERRRGRGRLRAGAVRHQKHYSVRY